MKVITIKDIARMAQVSASTVSRALKDHPDISKELTAKIKSIAESLNFKPNSFASSFRTQKSNLIGVILPQFHSNFIPEVLKGITSYLKKHNYQMVIFPTNDQLEEEKKAIEKCCDYRVDGVLLSLSIESHNLEHLELLKSFNIPAVIIDKTTNSDQYTQFTINDFEESKKCAQHLMEKNCKHVLAILGNEQLSISKDRIKGFMAGLSDQVELTIVHAESSEQSRQHVLQIMDQQSLDAIFGISDEVLLGATAALNEKKKLEEIELVGFSDGQMLPYLCPRLNYIHHDGLAFGEQASALLLNHLEHPEENTKQVKYMQVEFIAKT